MRDLLVKLNAFVICFPGMLLLKGFVPAPQNPIPWQLCPVKEEQPQKKINKIFRFNDNLFWC